MAGSVRIWGNSEMWISNIWIEDFNLNLGLEARSILITLNHMCLLLHNRKAKCRSCHFPTEETQQFHCKTYENRQSILKNAYGTMTSLGHRSMAIIRNSPSFSHHTDWAATMTTPVSVGTRDLHQPWCCQMLTNKHTTFLDLLYSCIIPTARPCKEPKRFPHFQNVHSKMISWVLNGPFLLSAVAKH